MDDKPDIPRVRNTCEEHVGERLRFYCTFHNDVICSICAIKRHKLCQDTLTFSEAIERFEREHQNLVKALDNQSLAIEKAVAEKQTVLRLLSSDADVAKDNINKICRKLHELIDEKRTTLLSVVKDETIHLRKELSSDLCFLNKMATTMTKVKVRAKRAFLNKSEMETVQSMIRVQNTYCDIEKSSKLVFDHATQRLAFHASADLQEFITNVQSIGQVSRENINNDVPFIQESSIYNADTDDGLLGAVGGVEVGLVNSSAMEPFSEMFATSFTKDHVIDSSTETETDESDEVFSRKEDGCDNSAETNEIQTRIPEVEPAIEVVSDDVFVNVVSGMESSTCSNLIVLPEEISDKVNTESNVDFNMNSEIIITVINENGQVIVDNCVEPVTIKKVKSDEKFTEHHGPLEIVENGTNIVNIGTETSIEPCTNTTELGKESTENSIEEFQLNTRQERIDSGERNCTSIMETENEIKKKGGTMGTDTENIENGANNWVIDISLQEQKFEECLKCLEDTTDSEILGKETQDGDWKNVIENAEEDKPKNTNGNNDNLMNIQEKQPSFNQFQALDHGKACWIYGIEFLCEDKIAISDVAHDSLQLFDTRGRFQCETTVSFTPWDLARIDDETVAVCSGVKGVVYVFNVTEDNFTLKSSFDAENDCNSIAYVNDKFFIGSRQGYMIFSTLGENIARVNFDKGTTGGQTLRRADFITVDERTQNVFIVNSWSGRISCVSDDGELLWENCTGEIYPRGVSLKDGKLFVSSKSLHKVIILDVSNGSLDDAKSGELECPYAIACSASQNVLAVTMWEENMEKDTTRTIRLVKY